MGSGAFLVAACRFLAELLVKAWHAHDERPEDPARRGRDPPRPPHRRPALPLRSGQEPDGGRPGQALALAGHAGEGPPVHVPRPRAAVRRFAGRALARTDPGLPLEAREAADFAARHHRGPLSRATTSAARSARRPTATPRRCCARSSLWPTRPEPAAILRRSRRRSVLCGSTTTGSGRTSSTIAEQLTSLSQRTPTSSTRRVKPLDAATASLLERRSHPVHPFHWEIEFPEVFDRKNPGFDALVGNPPFAGKNTCDGHRGRVSRLADDDPRRVARQRRSRGPLLPSGVRPASRRGRVRTDRDEHNRSRGHAESTGLRWICKHGGTIFEATRRISGPVTRP